MKVVLDTNTVVSAVLCPRGRRAWIRESWATGQVRPLVSRATTQALIEVLAYPTLGLDEEEIAVILAAYLPCVSAVSRGDRMASLSVTVPGVVFEDLIILRFSTSESAGALPGSVRAFSALDGELVWQFNTIPAPGDPGSETWADGSLAQAGGANAWSGMTLDEERGLLFAPTGSATPDFYGANRLGDNLYAERAALHLRARA